MDNGNIVKLKEKINSGDRDYFVLLEYLKLSKKETIKNMDVIECDINRLYHKRKRIYIELANYYIEKKEIVKAINHLEHYKNNSGDNIDVLISLSKQYLEVKNIKKAEKLLKQLENSINVEKTQKEEIFKILCSIEISKDEFDRKNNKMKNLSDNICIKNKYGNIQINNKKFPDKYNEGIIDDVFYEINKINIIDIKNEIQSILLVYEDNKNLI